ncbi:hypothetical protein AN913_21050 [Mycobacteroides immunogenum]|nr:hypothetical protein AN913_21050 [Mycobacteroides immunogenum]
MEAGEHLTDVKLWWGYPFGGPIWSFSGVPAVVQEAVVGSAGEGEVVDVGGSAVGPFGDVVDFAEVSGDRAAGVGAAAVAGV